MNLKFLQSISYKSISNISISKISFLCIFLYSLTLSYKYHLRKNFSNKSEPIKITPGTVFVFDLHGVIFNMDPIQVIKEVFACPHKSKLALTVFYPGLFYHVFSSLFKGEVAEQIVVDLKKNYPQFKNLTATGFNVINSQKPISSTVDLINYLKQNGHKLYILSNIGQDSINYLCHKFPDIFKQFDGILATTPEDNYIKKPNVKAFEKFLEKFNQDKTNLIFIDDKMKNIIVARSLGIRSILFTTGYELKRKIEFYKNQRIS